MIDQIAICLICGDVMDAPTKEIQRRFGKAKCCENEMVLMDNNKLLHIVRSINTLKKNLETRILEKLI
jgi:hypothetical protein